MDTPEHVWFLMSRNLSGEASAAEQEELMQLLQQHPQWMQQYDMMRTLWKPAAGRQDTAGDDSKIRQILQLAAAERDEAPVVSLQNHRSRRRRFFVAAVVIAMAGLSAWLMSHWLGNGLHKDLSQQEVVAQKGSKTRTLLPDGSTVWLNAGSKIMYPANFSGPIRNVSLQGEAFFDVVKDPNRPFIVHTADIDIKVLGTAFNVKSYDEDKTVETTLIRGLVQITRSNTEAAQDPIYLHPNQKIVLQKNDPAPAANSQEENTPAKTSAGNISMHITTLDSTRKQEELVETAWVYNRLEFRGDSFEELARKLERWYNIDIHFEDEAAKNLEFNGSLESETVEQAFQALKAAVPFSYTIKGNEIFVSNLE